MSGAGGLVAITRPAEQAASLAALLEAKGIGSLVVPAIRREPPSSWAGLDRGIALLGRGTYAGVLFTSPAAVEAFFSRGRVTGEPVIGAVGQGTAAALERHGVRAAIVPDEGNGSGLAGALIDRYGARLHGMRFLQPRAAGGREELSRELLAAGAAVDVVDAYRTVLASAAELDPLRRALEAGSVGAVIYASPSAVRAVAEAIGSPGEVPAVAIGGTTAVALQAWGAREVVVAERPDDEALAAAAALALRRNG
ncbi:uroporphyrinogen-III synthase [Vulgatibacter sp.]|uniref:uroporphyrinogen-III synthase n=1 Tax=Vulgatibacter sp. TaxID=1971226 RepID=UPI003565D5BF